MFVQSIWSFQRRWVLPSGSAPWSFPTVQHLGWKAGKRCDVTIHYKEREKISSKEKLVETKLKTVKKFHFRVSILDFPGCKSVTVRFSNLMIYRSMSSRCHPSWTFFVLPDSGWHLLPSLEIGGVLQVCTGRGQVSREKKSFDHEQMNRDEALNFSNTMDAWSTSKLFRVHSMYPSKVSTKEQQPDFPSRTLLKRSRMMSVFLRSPWMICEGGLLNQV